MKLTRLPLLAALVPALSLGLIGCTDYETNTEVTDESIANWQSVKSQIALQMAEDQFNGGQLALAEDTVNEALVEDPNNPSLWLMGGRIALENSELESAYLTLQRAIDLGEDSTTLSRKDKARPYYFQGIIDQRWQRFESARERYTMAYERDPENAAYFLARAEMMIQLGQVDEAIAELQSKVTYFDQNATVRALLGYALRRQGNHAEAAVWFNQAAMLAPEDMKLHEEHARSLMATGRFEQATRVLNEVVESEYGQSRMDLFRLLAQAYEQDGSLREARNTYARLTTMDNTSVQDWLKLGEVNYRIGDESGALQAANRLIHLVPDNHRGYLLAGMVWNRRDRLDRALSLFDRAAELAPEDTTPLIMRGIALQRNDRPAAAADAYRQALEIDPDDTRAQRLLSSVNEDLR